MQRKVAEVLQRNWRGSSTVRLAWRAPRALRLLAARRRLPPPADHCCSSLGCRFLPRTRCTTSAMPKRHQIHSQRQLPCELAADKVGPPTAGARRAAALQSILLQSLSGQRAGKGLSSRRDMWVLIWHCSDGLSPAPAQLGAATPAPAAADAWAPPAAAGGGHSCQHRSTSPRAGFRILTVIKAFCACQGVRWEPLAAFRLAALWVVRRAENASARARAASESPQGIGTQFCGQKLGKRGEAGRLRHWTSPSVGPRPGFRLQKIAMMTEKRIE